MFSPPIPSTRFAGRSRSHHQHVFKTDAERRRAVDDNLKVYVHFNFPKGTLSMRAAEGPSSGKVVDFPDSVVLEDAEFKISPAKREQSIKEDKRTQHAGVQGKLREMTVSHDGDGRRHFGEPKRWQPEDSVPAGYFPGRSASQFLRARLPFFMDLKNDEALKKADAVRIAFKKPVDTLNPEYHDDATRDAATVHEIVEAANETARASMDRNR